MPVSRNLSLPSSIETRKTNKRPDALRCLSMPRANSRYNNNAQVPSDQQSTDFPSTCFESTSLTNGSSANADVKLVQTTCSPVSRGTLSQPCLSENKTVGATSIFHHLFLGSQKDVTDKNLLEENNISNVVNVSSSCARPDHFDDDHFLRIAIQDNYLERITPYLDTAIDFIESIRLRNEKVLVHCLAGVSRSATVAVAYVMYYLRLTFEDAYRFVKDKRPTISPNLNFLGQLLEYQQKLLEQGHYCNTGATDVVINKNLSKVASGKADNQSFAAQTRMKCYEKPSKLELTVTSRCTASIPSFTRTHVTPTSSFCQRRKGPVLDKISFSKKHPETDVGRISQRLDTNSRGGAGVVLDLKVTVSPSELHSRRLGSDGREDEEDVMDNTWRSSHKYYSLPRNINSLTAKVFGNSSCPTPPVLNCLRDGVPINTRSFTAPNTPAFLRCQEPNDDIFSPRNSSPLDQYFSSDVEMSENEPADFEICSRIRSHTHPATFYLTKRNLSRSSDALLSITSDKISTARKSKSPKISRKSSNIHVRQLYQFGPQSKPCNSTLHQISAVYRNRSKEKPSLKVEPFRSLSVPTHCDSPGTEKLSTLTIYSPAVVSNNNPFNKVDQSAEMNDSTLAPSSGIKTNFQTASGCAATFRSKSGEPFRLASKFELKPKWRRRASKIDSVSSSCPNPENNLSSSQTEPASQNIINRSCSSSIGIISCT